FLHHRQTGAADRHQREFAHREQAVHHDQQEEDENFEADIHREARISAGMVGVIPWDGRSATRTEYGGIGHRLGPTTRWRMTAVNISDGGPRKRLPRGSPVSSIPPATHHFNHKMLCIPLTHSWFVNLYQTHARGD